MGTSTTSRDAGTGTTPSGANDGPPHARLRWLSRARSGATRGAAPPELIEELEREVALLREENARLRVGHARTGERPVNACVRDTLPLLRSQECVEDVDEPWELLTECMLMRDSLADACRELERGARELRQRLETILPGSEGVRAEALVSDDLRDAA